MLQLEDLFFDGVFADHFVGKHFVLLAYTVGAVYGLLFYGGVPPGINEVYVIGGGKIETNACPRPFKCFPASLKRSMITGLYPPISQ